MNPCQLNQIITCIANYLYANLSKENFRCLTVFISELGKSMFSMTLLGEICNRKEPPCCPPRPEPCKEKTPEK